MRLLLAAVLIFLTIPSIAATVIESRESGGNTGRISIEGEWVRFDDAGGSGQGYLLMNAKQRRFYIVDPREQAIIEFTSRSERDKRGDRKVEFRDIGEGPEIAGFPTRKYELVVDGKGCGQRLMSQQAAEIADLQRLLAAVGGLNPEAFMPEDMVQGFRDRTDPCDMAELQMDEKTRIGLGFPMKSMDGEGNTESEILSIRENVKIDSELFELPDDYTRTSVKEMMEGMRREMENNRQQLEQMMKQMSPEERARMEQMMKQLGSGAR